MRIKKALPFLMWGTWPLLTSAFQDASISMVSLGDHPSFNYWPSWGQEALPCLCLMEMAQSWECRDLRFLDDTHPLCGPGHQNALPARTSAVSEKGMSTWFSRHCSHPHPVWTGHGLLESQDSEKPASLSRASSLLLWNLVPNPDYTLHLSSQQPHFYQCLLCVALCWWWTGVGVPCV